MHRKIFQLTGCTASIGVGPNILLARLSTRKAKPSGVFMYHQHHQHHHSSEDYEQGGLLAFLDPLPVDALPGIGWSISDKMEEYFERAPILCRDVRERFVTVDSLQALLGKRLGERVYQFVRGIDDRPVMAADADDEQQQQQQHHAIRKTIGADINWGIRFEREDQFRRFLMDLCKEVTNRLTDPNGFPPPPGATPMGAQQQQQQYPQQQQHPEHARWVAGALTLKLRIRHPDAPVEPAKHLGCGQCLSFSHSVPVQPASARAEALYQAATTAFQQLQRRIVASSGGGGGTSSSLATASVGSWRWEDLRGVGITTSKLAFSEDGGGGWGSRSAGELLGRDPRQPNIHTLFQKQAAAQKEDPTSTATATTTATTMAKPETTAHRQDLFALSQLDPSVLQELPEEIRQEIQDALREKKRASMATQSPPPPPSLSPLAARTAAPRTPSKSNTPPQKRGGGGRNASSTLLLQGSPSSSTPTKITQYWTTTNKEAESTGTAVVRSTPMQLPNGDVVDPDSWSHLPSSLKREILEDVENQKRRKVMSPDKMALDRANKVRRKEESRRDNPTMAKSNLSANSNNSNNNNNKNRRSVPTSIVLAPRPLDHLVLAGEWHAVQEELEFWLNRFDPEVKAFQLDVQQLRSHLMDLVNALQLERADQVLRLISRRADDHASPAALETLKRGLVKEIREAIAMRVQL